MPYFKKRPKTNKRKERSFIIAVDKKQEKIFRDAQREEKFDLKDQKYAYFSLKYYARRRIIDYEMISRLRKGAKMLSIGVGPATLEKALLAFSIPPENIDIADIELHPYAKKTPFRKFVFDMTNTASWPSFGRKYDYIIFPESFRIGVRLWAMGHTNIPKQSAMQKEMRRKFYTIENKILFKEELSEREKTAFLNAFKGKLPEAEKAIEIIVAALRVLKKGGEIRISQHSLDQLELAYFILQISKITKLFVFDAFGRMIIKKE